MAGESSAAEIVACESSTAERARCGAAEHDSEASGDEDAAAAQQVLENTRANYKRSRDEASDSLQDARSSPPRAAKRGRRLSGQVSFTIYNALKEKDEDEYMLKLSNPAGVSQCSAFLSVETSQSQEAASGKRKVRFSLPKDSDIFLIPSNDNEIPKAPGEPKISDYKTATLNLKWTASPSDNDESETYITYIVEYRSSKSYAWSTYASNLTELNSHVTGLTPGLTYSFRIRAENGNGISEPSPVASTKTILESDAIVQKAELTKPKGTLLIGTKPSIVGDARDVRYYIEGETAEIGIPIFGSPTPKVKWFKGEVEIKSEDAYKLFRDRSGTEHLDIANASEKDEGLYKIVAENEYGVASHEFYLQQADPPIFIEPFKDVTVQNHEDVEITCKVDGIPYPEVKFYKDWCV